jgi:large subunit ribosomal protein L19
MSVLNLMTHLLVQKVEKKHIKAENPVIKPGYTVKVYQKIKEGEKERIQIFEGLVIAMNHGHGASKTMIVRKVVEGIGVEKIFPINSPNIAKIEVVRIGKVRRSKLFYMRNISGKAARLKEVMVSHAEEKTAPVEKAETKHEETAPAQETASAETNSGDGQTSMNI